MTDCEVEVLSLAQAAARYGVNHCTLYWHVKQGRLNPSGTIKTSRRPVPGYLPSDIEAAIAWSERWHSDPQERIRKPESPRAGERLRRAEIKPKSDSDEQQQKQKPRAKRERAKREKRVTGSMSVNQIGAVPIIRTELRKPTSVKLGTDGDAVASVATQAEYRDLGSYQIQKEFMKLFREVRRM